MALIGDEQNDVKVTNVTPIPTETSADTQALGHGLNIRVPKSKRASLVNVNPFYSGTLTVTESTLGMPTGSNVRRATFPPTAATVVISSSSADDAAAGTGARTVEIYGLLAGKVDGGYEQLTLNGQTAVEGVVEFFRVQRMLVSTAGSGGTNAGDIYITNNTDTHTTGEPDNVVYCAIRAGFNHDTFAMYSIPTGKNLYWGVFSVYHDSSKIATINEYDIGDFTGFGDLSYKFGSLALASTNYTISHTPGFTGTDIEFAGFVSSGTTETAVYWGFWLADV
jgi:hypothetical protein